MLGETAKQPQFIATMHRRGYRFIAPVTPVDMPETSAVRDAPLDIPARPLLHAPHGSDRTGTMLVDREAEFAWLHQWFRGACHGQRHVVFVTGEAGIGKTTLVDAFLAQIATQQPLRMGAVSALTSMGLGKPICRCWKRAGRWDRPPMGLT